MPPLVRLFVFASRWRKALCLRNLGVRHGAHGLVALLGIREVAESEVRLKSEKRAISERYSSEHHMTYSVGTLMKLRR